MNQQCIICLNTCIVPVQLKCFECFDERKINCNSLKRVCLLCFLEMENKIVKCFFCPSKKVSENFAIDFQGIQNDEISILSCHFCSKTGYGHMELYKHMMDKHVHECDCGMFFHDEKQHYTYCQRKKWCERCQKFKKECVHQKCKYCKKYHAHSSEKCMERPFSCPQCNMIYPANIFMNHFMEHLDENRNSQKALQNSISKYKKDYKKLMNMLPVLYKEVYDENMS